MAATESGPAPQAFVWGSSGWPELQLDHCVFEQYLTTRGLSTGALDRRLAQDLFLACACLHGVPSAIESFDARYRPAVEVSARIFDSSEAFSDEVRQELHTHLFVAADGEIPRIAQYNGRGPLTGWVTTAARRVALRLFKRRKSHQYAGDEALVMQVCKEQDPELAWLSARYRELFNEALMLAFRQLSDRDRVIFRLYAHGGVSMGRIAIMHNVTQPTVSRWMRDARERILRAVYEFVHHEVDVDSGDLASIVRLVQSQLDLNLSSLFQDA